MGYGFRVLGSGGLGLRSFGAQGFRPSDSNSALRE